jgi:UDP-glucose 4-epimerase
MMSPIEIYMFSKKILITGVAGFLGRYIARHFNEAGCETFGMGDSSPENAPTLWLSGYQQCRLPEVDALKFVVDCRPDVVIHCAGRASVPHSFQNPDVDFRSNTIVPFELLETLRTHNPACRFIFLSSAAVYGNPESLPIKETAVVKPISPYGFHKRQAELLCEEYAAIHGVRGCSLRVFSAYGAGLQRQVLWDIAAKLNSGNKHIHLFGTGEETRDFIHSRDIAAAIGVVMVSAPLQGEVYNLASGVETRIADLVGMLMEKFHIKIPVEWDGKAPPGNPGRWLADISKIKQLGYIPRQDLGLGISEFVDWCSPLLKI